MTRSKPWRIQHHDLSDQTPTLEPSQDHQGLTLILWLHGVPLGKLDYLEAELPVPASALVAAIPHAIAPAVGDRVFGRGFEGALPTRRWWDRPPPDLPDIAARPDLKAALLQALAPPDPPLPGEGLSVVICTRDRPGQLARCLESLGPNLPFIGEVIVVDNGTQPDATRAVAARHPQVRLVAEPRPGLSVARNTGLRHSRRKIVAFTDDDVVAHRDWAARLLAGFTSEDTMCVTGLVLPTELETAAQQIFERALGGFGQGLQRISYDSAFFRETLPYGVPVWRIGAGANMAIRRVALDLVGGFDERLGAGAAGCSEDSELWYRILAAGWTVRYEPAAVVFHEHRRGWRDLSQQMQAYMQGHVAALLIQYAQHRHAGNLRRLAVTIPLHYLRVAKDAALQRDRLGRFQLVGAELRGVFAGLGAVKWLLRPHRQHRHHLAEAPR